MLYVIWKQIKTETFVNEGLRLNNAALLNFLLFMLIKELCNSFLFSLARLLVLNISGSMLTIIFAWSLTKVKSIFIVKVGCF